MSDFTTRLKMARKNAGLTQEEASKKIETTRVYLAQVETEKENPSDKFIRLASYAYGVNQEWLKDGTGEMYPDADDRVGSILADVVAHPDEKLYVTVLKIMEYYQQLNDANKKIIDGLIDSLRS